jgi:hypothetical protein
MLHVYQTSLTNSMELRILERQPIMQPLDIVSQHFTEPEGS